MDRLTLEEGTFAVKYARAVIENYLAGKDITPVKYPKKFDEPRGVFVTLHTYPERALRGCIGIPEPVMPLIEALKEAAISAAVKDPRFPPVTLEEMDNIVVEVSVLTPPKLIEVEDPLEYLDKIKIGRDGLIIEYGMYRGLLLPQVPVEHGWDVAEYLSNLCLKASLPPDAWLKYPVKIYSFQAQIFEEVSPRGPVVEKSLID
ncbi:MAG TPA: TIGR00296 family protein [Methanothermococcus okinawensis]|uniref:Protein EYH21_04470 n=1 Tax=Methanothermococcus okinawensis TaxID=155863 RepID=A0A832ZKF6_9EURY|nr:TIGR00296 family protein [Methanothermococcus okinawensis]